MEIELTEAQKTELEALKTKYGSIRTLFVPLDEDDETKIAVLFLRKPDGSVRSLVDSFVNKGATNKAIESALKNLMVGGDDISVVLKSDDAMASLDYALVQLFSVQRTVIKKN